MARQTSETDIELAKANEQENKKKQPNERQNNQQSSTQTNLEIDYCDDDDNTDECSSMDSERQSEVIQALAKRSYHLPGNTCCEDYVQWYFNGHPILGICFRHPLHPVGIEERLLLLIGSFAFGLAATSAVYIYFYYETTEMDEVVYAYRRGDETVFAVTRGMVALWTVGCFFHSVFDYILWQVTACACCQPGGVLSRCRACNWIGSPISFFIVLATVFVAAMAVLIRSDIEVKEGETRRELGFSFIFGYLVELTLALFCYSPIIGFVLFSGVLGCGRLPVLGGRPRAIWLREI